LDGRRYVVRVFVDIDRVPAEVVTVYRSSKIAKLLERVVKATYDQKTDTLTIVLKENVAIAESDEDKPGVVLDYDADGDLVSIELLDASKRVDRADRIDVELIG
jgi:uncharacterized protein YuzE